MTDATGRRAKMAATKADGSMSDSHAPGPRMGRPRFPPGKAKSECITVRLSPRDRAVFNLIGGAVWLRRQLEEAALRRR